MRAMAAAFGRRRTYAALLQLVLLQVFHDLFQHLELGPRLRQHGLLHLELLARDEIELVQGRAQHRAEIILEVLAHGPETLGHRFRQLPGDVFDRFIVHKDVIPQRRRKGQSNKSGICRKIAVSKTVRPPQIPHYRSAHIELANSYTADFYDFF